MSNLKTGISSLGYWKGDTMVMAWMSLYNRELLRISVNMIPILEKWLYEKPWPSLQDARVLEIDLVSRSHCLCLLFSLFLKVANAVISHLYRLGDWLLFWLSVEMLAELARREKTANIKPDLDIDVFMKVRQKLLSIKFVPVLLNLIYLLLVENMDICIP